uniref:hypothetical protein n=1 Tax=uncultured Megasphaera sp. TaxID=165188 RepID=UPI002594A68E
RVKKMARSKPFSFNTLFRPEPGPYRCQHKKKQVKMLKKKIYKKALQMVIDEIADCSFCPLGDKDGNIVVFAKCTQSRCVDVIMNHWLRKAEQELRKA